MVIDRANLLKEAAAAAGFTQSSDPTVGQLLAVLVGRVPRGGRVLELGTGLGVGTASIVDGLVGRNDVGVVTVEIDAGLVDRAKAVEWPPNVEFIVGDALQILPSLGTFDVVFADATAGKWFG